MGHAAGPRSASSKAEGNDVRTTLYNKLEQSASGFAEGQTALGLLVPYNALEVGQRHSYTSLCIWAQ